MNKKILSLLILVLILFPVFGKSKLGGEARLSFGLIHRNDQGWPVWDFGFLNNSEANFSLMLDENTRELNSDSDGMYAEVKARADVRIKASQYPIVTNGGWKKVPDKFFKFKVYLDHFNVVIDRKTNFKVSLMGSLSETRYAKGWETEENGSVIGTSTFISKTALLTNEPLKNSASPCNGWIPGLAIIYGKLSLSIGIDAGYGNHIENDFGEKYNSNTYASRNIGMLLLLAADDIQLGDILSLSGSVGFVQSSDFTVLGNRIGAQRHLVFGGKMQVTLADFLLNIGGNGNLALIMEKQYTDVWQPYSVEASGEVAYRGILPISLEIWYLDNWALWNAADKPKMCTIDNKNDLGYVYRDADGKLIKDNKTFLHQALSARFRIDPFKMFGVVIRFEDIMNQLIIGADVPIRIGGSLTITPSFEFTNNTNKKFIYGYWIPMGTKNSIAEGKVALDYEHELFKVGGSLRLGKESLMHSLYFKPAFEVSTDKIIKNLTLKFKWKGATFASMKEFYAPSLKAHGGVDAGEFVLEGSAKF